MADIDDRWMKDERDPATGEVVRDPKTGKPVRTRSNRYGAGKRYAARWRDEKGTQRSRSFDRRQDASTFLADVVSRLARGTYIDPSAGKERVEDYAAKWLAAQTFDPSTREAVELRLRLHVFPALGGYELRAVKPSDVQQWSRSLEADTGLASSTIRVVFANVSAIFKAAMDDEIIAANPCRAGSVKPPRLLQTRVVPWPVGRVDLLRAALPPAFAETVTVAAGSGQRQGEVFGLSPDDVDGDRRVIHVRRQVKIVGSRLVLAPPKRGKTRDVPLSQLVADRLADHMKAYPPRRVVLPWLTPDGPPRAVRLVFTTRESGALNRNYFNRKVWKPALDEAGIPSARDNGMHALRHLFASLVLDGGASIRDLADWLGHEDPGFTLRVYSHLLPNSAEKLRGAVDRALGGEQNDGPS